MKKTIPASAMENIHRSLNIAGIPVTKNQEGDPLWCSFFLNTDGSARWIWPATSTQADFLHFYYSAHWRSALLAALIRLVFKLGLQKVIFRPQLIGYLDKNTSCQPLRSWALFTGTAGPNQKMVVYKQNQEGKKIFSKIALSETASQNIHREWAALTSVQQQNHSGIETPELIERDSQRIDLSAIGLSNHAQRATHLAALPTEALQNWLQQGLCYADWSQTDSHRLVKDRLAQIEQQKDPRLPQGLVRKLQILVQWLERHDKKTPLAYAHGDFTPWNLKYEQERLLLLDWELSQPSLPALYDLFHYVYQSNVLISRKGYATIRKELDQLFGQAQWAAFLEQNELQASLLEQHYLVYTLSYYLNLYSQQKNWHLQISWLLEVWSEALTQVLAQEKAMQPRQLLLLDTADQLRKQPHAALKFDLKNLEDLPEDSDIDLCVNRSGAQSLSSWLKKHPLVSRLQTKTFSFMQQVEARLTDNSTLSLDFIWQFKQKNWIMLDAAQVLSNAQYAQCGIQTASQADNFLYIWLFYQLNGAGVPARYRRQYSQLAPYEQTLIGQQINTFLGGNAAGKAFDWAGPAVTTQTLQQKLAQMPANRNWRHWINTLAYWFDSIKRFTFGNGFLVTFSGVDGAGKTTVIQNVQQRLEKQLRRRVIVLRHRPSLLPILSAWKYGRENAQARSVASLPRQGTNNSRSSSLARFAYYFADYFFGQFYIQLKYLSRGYIVLYDRYFFDFINDSRRSNIQLPQSWVSPFYRLLLKPKHNFFLYASAEEILKRKQELSAETIETLTQSYLQSFQQFGARFPDQSYTSIENTNLEQTTHFIIHQIRQHA